MFIILGSKYEVLLEMLTLYIFRGFIFFLSDNSLSVTNYYSL
jgi:hypothetical protein